MQEVTMELTEQQTMILKAAAMRAMDAKTKYDVADRNYNELVAIITPPGSSFDSMHRVFYREVPDEEVGPQLVEDEEITEDEEVTEQTDIEDPFEGDDES